MRAGIDILSCHSNRNRTIISGNQVLCASPEGIFLNLLVSRPFSLSAFTITKEMSLTNVSR